MRGNNNDTWINQHKSYHLNHTFFPIATLLGFRSLTIGVGIIKTADSFLEMFTYVVIATLTGW